MTTKEIHIEAMKMVAALAKSEGITRKEAYALAKGRIMQAQVEAEEARFEDKKKQNVPVITRRKFINMLERGTALVTYTNPKGKQLTVYGTLNKSKITTNYKIQGRAKVDDKSAVVVFDRRHGCWRTIYINNIISAEQYNIFL